MHKEISTKIKKKKKFRVKFDNLVHSAGSVFNNDKNNAINQWRERVNIEPLNIRVFFEVRIRIFSFRSYPDPGQL